MKKFETQEEVDAEAKKVANAIITLIRFSEKVTSAHIYNTNQGKVWTENDQLIQMHSEVDEVYKAIRGYNRDRKSFHHVFDEIIDCIFADVTMLNIIKKHSDKYPIGQFNEQVRQAVEYDVDKVLKRCGLWTNG